MYKLALSTFFVLLSCHVQAEPFAYITNQGADTVTVVDLATQKVTATIPTGKAPVGVDVYKRQSQHRRISRHGWASISKRRNY